MSITLCNDCRATARVGYQSNVDTGCGSCCRQLGSPRNMMNAFSLPLGVALMGSGARP